MSDVSAASTSFRSLLKPGLRALRCHWPQLLFFQGLSLALVVGYFHVEGLRRFCENLTVLKQQWGMLFAAVSMVIAGVIFPECVKLLLRSANRIRLDEIVSTIAFFAVGGIIIDLQYRGLAMLLGNGSSASTVIAKMLIDQFVTTPLYGVPYWVVVFAWRSNAYRLRPTLSQISANWYLNSVVPLLLPAWCFWIPMTLMIYSLPSSLQFSLFALAMSAWSLIMVFVANRQTEA